MEVNILNEREQVYRSSDAPKLLKEITELTERETVYYKSSDPKADCDNFVDMYEEDYIVEEDIGINIPNVEKCPSKCGSQNTDTHYTAKLIVGTSNESETNDNAENGNVYINIVENSTVRSSNNIVGEGDISVSSDTTGKIIIESHVGENLGLDVTNLFNNGSSLLGNISDLITKKLYTKDDSGNLTYPVTFYPHGDTEDNISSSVGYLYREHITQVSGQISTKKYIATIRQNGPYIVCDAVDSRTSTL